MEESIAASGRTLTATDKDFEEDDPYELVGVRFPLPEGVDADREVARCFVEEFALMGSSAAEVRRLFTDAHYRGSYDVAQRRGMGFVDELIAEVFGPFEGER